MNPSTPTRWLDAFLYSSGAAAVVAATLLAAVEAALRTGAATGARPPSLTLELTLAFTGTFAVYNLDRLRDLPRDRASWPRRSHFVQTHRRNLTALCALAGAGAVLAGLALGTRVVLLCAAVAVFALLHRRLKGSRGLKIAYLIAAWIGIVVGVPWVARGTPPALLFHALAAAGIVGCSVTANLIASNLGDGASARRRRLGSARMVAALGVLLALLAITPWPRFTPIPVAQLLALVAFRDDERYALAVVDGSLALGAALSLALMTL